MRVGKDETNTTQGDTTMAANRTITDGKGRALVSGLTDVEAVTALRRVRAGGDAKFAGELASLFQGGRLTQSQYYWFHKLAIDQVNREASLGVPATQPALTVIPRDGRIPAQVVVNGTNTIAPRPRQEVAPANRRPIEYTNTTRRGLATRPAPQQTDEEVYSLADGQPPAAESFTQDAVDTLRACMLIYDIPVPRNGESEIPNPSPALRRVAIRVNLSCWVIQEGDIPYTLLENMRRRGASWHVVPFDPKGSKQLLEMAIGAMKKEIADAAIRSRQVQANAEDVLADNEAPSNNRKRYLARAEQIRERFNTLTSDLTAAAERFGINPDMLGISQAHAAVQAIQTAMHTRARLYVEAAAKAREVASAGGNAIAAHIEQGTIPAGIVADFLDDNGQDGESLRTAFDDNAGE